MGLESGAGASCLLSYAKTIFSPVVLLMDTLNPAIVDIAPGGLSLSDTATGPQLGLEEPEERFDGPLTINLNLIQQGNPITVTGTLEGTAIRQCVRCLTDFLDPIEVSLYAEFVRQPDETAKVTAESGRKGPKRPAETAEHPLETEEDEVYLYQGDHLDLAPMVREQVILAAPMRPLCREDCLGLCPQCGQNLNERPCACPPATAPSPFRVLRERRSKGENA